MFLEKLAQRLHLSKNPYYVGINIHNCFVNEGFAKMLELLSKLRKMALPWITSYTLDDAFLYT